MKDKNKLKYKLVHLEWVDAVGSIGWEDGTVAHVDKCVSVGYVVNETKDAVCIASTLSKKSNNARMHIPKSWIIKRSVLGSIEVTY
jgi:hypothetical protein